MIRYLTPEELLWIHRRVVETTGGDPAVRDPNLVQSAAVRPSAGVGKRDTYPGLAGKAAALLEALVLYHPFVDANRRVALVAAGIFLEQNGRRLRFRPAEAESFLRRLAAGGMPFEEVEAWIGGRLEPAREAARGARRAR